MGYPEENLDITISTEERESLLAQAHAGCRVAKERIAELFAPVIRRTALRRFRLCSHPISLDDLIGAGQIGLVESFSRHSGKDWKSFAVLSLCRIKGEITCYVRRERAYLHGASVATIRLAALVNKAERDPDAQAALKKVDDTRLAAVSNLSLIRHLHDAVGHSWDDDGKAIVDSQAEPCCASQEDQLAEAELAKVVRDAVAELPERLRLVLTSWAIDGVSLADIGRSLGRSDVRVNQLKKQATSQIREGLLARGYES